MKLIIQIPCYNEAQTLPGTLRDLPREVAGFEQVETLVIDDGSSDETAEVARQWGVEHVVRHRRNRGLAATFATGLETALRLGADVIVNTDGDNQYAGRDVPRLVAPILRGEADLVIGDRQTWTNPHFSPLKRLLQRVGSRVVSCFAGQPIPDAVSGFRALSREAVLKLHVVTSFSYTIETTLQAAHQGLAIASVPIATNAPTRSSRLFRSLPQFLFQSLTTMLRVYAMYHSLAVFVWLSLLLMAGGALPIARFLWLFFSGDGDGHVQSLILGGVLFLCGCLTLAFGLLADLISFNRRLLENTLLETRRRAWDQRRDQVNRASMITWDGEFGDSDGCRVEQEAASVISPYRAELERMR